MWIVFTFVYLYACSSKFLAITTSLSWFYLKITWSVSLERRLWRYQLCFFIIGKLRLYTTGYHIFLLLCSKPQHWAITFISIHVINIEPKMSIQELRYKFLICSFSSFLSLFSLQYIYIFFSNSAFRKCRKFISVLLVNQVLLMDCLY